MCLLICKPEGKTVPFEYLQNAIESNPHGCGITFPSRGKVIVKKNVKWKAKDIAKALDKIGTAPALIHFRWATHGSKINDNTHPFLLPGNQWSAAHNGIISGIKTRKDESDTRAFLRKNVVPVMRNLKEKEVQGALEKFLGMSNKVALLNADGSHIILNESQGHWNDGVWYSNTGYKSNSYPVYGDEDDYWSGMDRSEYSGGKLWYSRPESNLEVKEIAIPSNYIRMKVMELACDYCGTHVSGLGHESGVAINKSTGTMYCEECESFLNNVM